jgi:hypothetical protein
MDTKSHFLTLAAKDYLYLFLRRSLFFFSRFFRFFFHFARMK